MYFIERINLELKEIDKGILSLSELVWGCCTITHILSCYSIIIEDNFDFYSDILIYDIKQQLKELIDIYTVVEVGERRLGHYS